MVAYIPFVFVPQFHLSGSATGTILFYFRVIVLTQEQSPRSGSRERLTPRSREKNRSKRDSGHVSDDELLSARSRKKHGHGLDNLGYLDDNDTHYRKRRYKTCCDTFNHQLKL